MCGRFVQDIKPSQYLQTYGLASVPDIPSRFNVAPSQQVAVVRLDASGERYLASLRWGLIPSWAKDLRIGYKMINARSETVHEKPSFRAALQSRRCIVPANGFYEWQKVGKEKVPHYIRRADGLLMSLAGLWDAWTSPDGQTIESCTILTTGSNALLKPIHDRMPVILRRDAQRLWLTRGGIDPAELSGLCCPYPSERMEEYVVAKDVNNPGNDRPENLLPA